MQVQFPAGWFYGSLGSCRLVLRKPGIKQTGFMQASLHAADAERRTTLVQQLLGDGRAGLQVSCTLPPVAGSSQTLVGGGDQQQAWHQLPAPPRVRGHLFRSHGGLAAARRGRGLALRLRPLVGTQRWEIQGGHQKKVACFPAGCLFYPFPKITERWREKKLYSWNLHPETTNHCLVLSSKQLRVCVSAISRKFLTAKQKLLKGCF